MKSGQLQPDRYAFREVVENFVKFFEVSGQLVRFEMDSFATPGASHLLVRCYPSESLRHLVAAAGAVQINISSLEHGSAPKGGAIAS